MKTQNQISADAYKSAGFIGKYQRLVKDVVIPYQYSVLRDEAPDIEKSHVIQNFINAGKALRGGRIPGTAFTAWSFRTATWESG